VGIREAEGMMIGSNKNNKNNNTTSITKTVRTIKDMYACAYRIYAKYNGNVQFLLYINRKII
jgi:hypothetical protein